MNKRRLLKLADLLEADAKNKKGVKFDLSSWAVPAGGIVFEGDERTVPVDCNTSACAMGLACISGAFKREGLTYEFDYSMTWNGFILEPRHEGRSGFEAAASLFDIVRSDAFFLFDPDQYPPNKVKGAAAERFVAKRIRDFVAGKVTS